MKQIPLDASYLLDFRSAKLFATTPELAKNSNRLVSEMSVRDLIVDFKLEPGIVPHFLMIVHRLAHLEAEHQRC